MRGGPRPSLIQNRVNYEVMGANVWRHASSLDAMGTESETLYLTNARVSQRLYQLSPAKPMTVSALPQRVDFKDRTTTNNDSYPFLIEGKKPDISNGYSFLTRPFSTAADVSGLSARIHAICNKRDMDVGVVLYEIEPGGQLFQLSYGTIRASYSGDMNNRVLLTPGKPSTIVIGQATLFSRRIPRGARLLLTLNVNKNPFAEINYGTGKDVSHEDIHDASAPLEVQWLTDSSVTFRLTPA